MRYIVVSDVHANYVGLDAVLEDAPPSDGVLFCGDAVGLMGFPRESLELLMEKSVHAVKGNHDIAVVENEQGHVNSKALSEFELRTTLNALTKRQKSWIKGLTAYKEIRDEGLLMAHAEPTPSRATGLEKRNPGVSKGSFPKVAANVDTDVFDFVLLGHTHSQALLDCAQFGNDVVVINPGSVGQNLGGGADYAVIDTETGEGELHSTEYDASKVIERLELLDVPIRWWEK